MKIKNILAFCALSVPALVCVANAQTATTKPTPAVERAVVKASGQIKLRFLHAVPGGPAVDILVDGAKVSTGHAYKKISDYVTAKSGRRKIQVVATGTSTPILVEEPKTLTSDKNYTVVIHGKPTPKLLFLTDTAKMAGGRTRIRVSHLVFGGPKVLITTPSTRAEAGFTKFISTPLAPGESRAKSFAPKAHKFQIRTEEGKLLKESAETAVAANKPLGLFVVGDANGTGALALDILTAPLQ